MVFDDVDLRLKFISVDHMGYYNVSTLEIEDIRVSYKDLFILEWTTSLDTSSRTLFVRICVGMSTSRRTSSYVITSDCY